MKICILTDSFPSIKKVVGGAEKSIYTLANYFQDMENEVIVITSTQEKKRKGLFRDNGMKVYSLFSNNFLTQKYLSQIILFFNPQIVLKVKKILLEEKPDVIYASNIYKFISLQSLRVASQLNIPTVLVFRDSKIISFGKIIGEMKGKSKKNFPIFSYRIDFIKSYNLKKRLFLKIRNKLIKKFIPESIKFVAVSNELKKALEENWLNNVKCIYNGIDIKEVKNDQINIEKLKNKFQLKNKFVILLCGRLSYLKGIKYTILAMKEVAKYYNNTILIISGRKNEFIYQVQALVKSLSIEKNVLFIGWLDELDLSSMYEISDIVVSPSIYLDPFPRINLEAMLHRKPIVGTCFGGTKEIVIEGTTGFIVNPLNIKDFADKITYLLKNRNIRKIMGENGYKRVNKYFNVVKYGDSYLRLFQKISTYKT